MGVSLEWEGLGRVRGRVELEGLGRVGINLNWKVLRGCGGRFELDSLREGVGVHLSWKVWGGFGVELVWQYVGVGEVVLCYPQYHIL